jgi:hypothetical protein
MNNYIAELKVKNIVGADPGKFNMIFMSDDSIPATHQELDKKK